MATTLTEAAGIPAAPRANSAPPAEDTANAQSGNASVVSLQEFRALMAAQHPFSAELGIEIEALGAGTARAVLPARPSHQRLGGIVAGPMLMGLADVALYAAVVSATGEAHAVTASLTINFLRGCPAGDIVAEARLLKVGRLCTGEVTLTPRAGTQPVAHAVSTWALPRPREERAGPMG